MNASQEATSRDILESVAAGQLPPEKAAQLLTQLKSAQLKSAEPPTKPASAASSAVWAEVTDQPVTRPDEEAPRPSVPASAEPQRVVIRAVGHRVRVVGEPSVATVAVDGPHVVRREGSTITIASEGEFGASLDGFTLMRSRSVSDLRDRLLGFGREISIRVNPRLAVDVEITAGSLVAERLPHLSQVRVTAGSAKVLDATDPLDLLVQAGSAKVEVRPTSGRSRLRVESGSLDVRLRVGSDVRVHSDVQAGRVQWHGRDYQGNAGEAVLGSGAAVLSVEAVMGTVQLRTD